MSPASELTIRAAVEQFRVSRKTIRRRLADGSLDGARQRHGDHGPEWVFPVESLERLGYERRDPSASTPGSPAPGPARSRTIGRTAIAVAVLLLVCVGAVVGYAVADLAEDDAESADPVLAVLTGVTVEGDLIGVVGSGVSAAVPPGRIPVPIDGVDALEDAPRYVVVGPDAPERVIESLEANSIEILALASSPRKASVFDRATADTTVAARSSPATTATPSPDMTAPGSTSTSTSTPEAPLEPDTGIGAGEAGVEPTAQVFVPAEDDPPTAGGRRPVTVVEGDSFWSIAEDVVTARSADAGVDTITSYWASLIDANLDRLVEPGNTDLLLPGQDLLLPGS